MMKALKRFVLIAAAFGAVLLAWRWISRRRQLPCPTWLSWMLEGTWVDKLFKTSLTLDRLDLQPGQRVLEIGPGPGRLLIPAARRVLPGGDVTGLDLQPGMIRRLKERAAKAGVTNLTAMLGDATLTPLRAHHYDRVCLCTVLGEIPDREAILRQSFAALKPKGILSITEVFPDPHYQPREAVNRLATAAGFCFQATYGPWYFYTTNFVKPEKEQPLVHDLSLDQ